MARPTKLNDDIENKILERLRAGATIKSTCESAGIGVSTFYQWIEIGNAYLMNEDHDRMPRLIKERELFAEFAEATTRAQADGMITATIQFKKGMMPHDTTSTTTETLSETRLDKDGNAYQYTRTVTKNTVNHYQGDWRAAMEYLARRDPENWARQKINHEVSGPDGKPVEVVTLTWEEMVSRNADTDDS